MPKLMECLYTCVALSSTRLGQELRPSLSLSLQDGHAQRLLDVLDT